MNKRLRIGTRLLLFSLLTINLACTSRLSSGNTATQAGSAGTAPSTVDTPIQPTEAPAYGTESVSATEKPVIKQTVRVTSYGNTAEARKETATAQAEINWLSLDEAFELNKKAPRKIFVDVYTDWCGWCKRMDKDTFGNPEVAQYVNKHYYAVKLNAESDRKFKLGEAEMTDRQVASQMGVSGYPTVVFIQEDFKTILPVSGYHKPAQFLKMLQAFVTEPIKK